MTSKAIKCAIHSCSWNVPRGTDFEPWLDQVVEAGYEGVALFSFQLQSDGFLTDPDRLHGSLEARGLELAALTASLSEDPAVTEGVMDFMVGFGTSHLALVDTKPDLTIPDTVKILERIGRASKPYGVNVYYHHNTRGVGKTMAQFEELIELADHTVVHVMLDTGNATKDFTELPLADRAAGFFERHWQQVEYLELKDWNEESDFNIPVGEGCCDFNHLFGLVEQRGYAGNWFVVEQISTMGLSLGRTPLECAKISRNFLSNYGY